MPTSSQAISLYRSLLRHSGQFSAYNFREYALRRTRDAFRQHRTETNPERIVELITRGQKELQIVKRQSAISQLYKSQTLVVENPNAISSLSPSIS